MTRMQPKATAALECESCGRIRSARRRASFDSCGTYDVSASRMYARDHLLMSADEGQDRKR